jgi:Tfp pilus assembly protein PilF
MLQNDSEKELRPVIGSDAPTSYSSWVYPCAVLVTTALAYAATLRFGFVYDDERQIYFNQTLTTWKTLPHLFMSHSWSFMQPGWAGNYYRPLFMSWLLVNRMVFGLSAPLWHAATLMVHLAATYMAFVVARQILRNVPLAAATALLFGLHPIHIESVAWLSGVTDPLMAFFTLGGFWAWLRGRQNTRSKSRWQILATVLFAAGCLCKETAFFLPVMIVAYEYWFNPSREPRRDLLASLISLWPLWGTGFLYVVVRTYVLHGIANPAYATLRGAPLLMTLPMILWDYIRLLVWPVGLSVFYVVQPVTRVMDWRLWLAAFGLIAMVAVTWRLAKDSPISKFSLLWTALFLAPAIIGLPVFHIDDLVHDRYLYLPAFGFCLLIVHVVSRLRSSTNLFGYPARAAAILLPLATVMAFGTSMQEQYWSSSFLLFMHSAHVEPRSSIAKGELARIFRLKGDHDNARQLLRQAVDLDPDNWKYNTDLGELLYEVGDFRAAEARFTRALSIDPTDPNVHFDEGMSRYQQRNYSGAEQSFKQALRLGGSRPSFHYWLGCTYQQRGKAEEAAKEFDAELAEYPSSPTDAEQRRTALRKK